MAWLQPQSFCRYTSSSIWYRCNYQRYEVVLDDWVRRSSCCGGFSSPNKISTYSSKSMNSVRRAPASTRGLVQLLSQRCYCSLLLASPLTTTVALAAPCGCAFVRPCVSARRCASVSLHVCAYSGTARFSTLLAPRVGSPAPTAAAHLPLTLQCFVRAEAVVAASTATSAGAAMKTHAQKLPLLVATAAVAASQRRGCFSFSSSLLFTGTNLEGRSGRGVWPTTAAVRAPATADCRPTTARCPDALPSTPCFIAFFLFFFFFSLFFP